MVIPADILRQLMPFHCLFDPELELSAILAEFARTKARSFLEIGTNRGATSAAVAALFPEARVVTLDLPDSLRTQWNPIPHALVGEAHRALEVQARIEQRFTDSSEMWRFAAANEHYDLVFIDADHSTDAVFRDLILSADLLSEDGGLLIVHDFTAAHEASRPSWTIGVQHAVDRFLEVRPFVTRRLPGLLLALERKPSQSIESADPRST